MPNKRRSPKSNHNLSAFHLLVLITTAVFAASLTLLVVLANVWDHPTAVQTEVIHTVTNTVNATLGTIVGLLGGKLTT
jgi:hypothetical protein